MTMTQGLHENIDLPSGVTAVVKDSTVTLHGPKGEVTRPLEDAHVRVAVEGNRLVVTSPNTKRRGYSVMRTFSAHLRNMVQGVAEGFVYKLKICSGHFPMNVSVAGDQFIIKNFIGEKTPRAFTLSKGVKVDVAGDDITVQSPNLELASQTAASIEQLAKRRGFDTRIFQSGIYITSKAGKELA